VDPFGNVAPVEPGQRRGRNDRSALDGDVGGRNGGTVPEAFDGIEHARGDRPGASVREFADTVVGPHAENTGRVLYAVVDRGLADESPPHIEVARPRSVVREIEEKVRLAVGVPFDRGFGHPAEQPPAAMLGMDHRIAGL
jgi:hypothetical protein